MTRLTKTSCLATAVLAVSFLACVAPGASGTDGEAAPDFELASLSGELVNSSALAGKVVLLEFWATWCTPCVAQARILEPLHREFDERGVEFLAISLGEDAATVQAYVERTPFPYPVLLDPNDRLSSEIGIYALPTVMILDREGRITYQQPGLSDGEVLRRVLEETVAGSRPTEARSG